MKKILYLHSGAELYGADQILLKIVTNINKDEYKPIVILPSDGPLKKKLEENGIETKKIEYPIIRRKYFNIKGIINFVKEYKSSCEKIIKIVEDEKIDIIHNNTIAVLEGIYVHKKTKKPLIMHIHEMIEHPKIIAKILYKIALKNSDKLIVVSNAVKKYIETMIKKSSDNIEVIHNGIENEIFNNKKEVEYLYEEFNIPKDSTVIGTIGRVNAIKGQNDFIDVMNEIIKNTTNVYALIVGDAFAGQEWRVEQLKKYIEDLNLKDRIKYTGFRTDISNIQNFLDIYVLPSIQKDSFPTVVLEAMASSKPIIAYKCGGVIEMVDDKVNGFLVEIGNKEELKNKIQTLLQQPSSIKDMGEKSLNIVKSKFNLNKFIKNIENTYKSLE